MTISKLILLIFLLINIAYASSQAVVLIYHRVGESRYPSTNVTVSEFSKQMQWLHEHDYNVLSLSRIAHALKAKWPLPEHTVGISFDDAYRSVYNNAFPILEKYKYPFTIFVATEPVRRHFGDMMSWQQLAELVKNEAEIGNHTA